MPGSGTLAAAGAVISRSDLDKMMGRLSSSGTAPMARESAGRMSRTTEEIAERKRRMKKMDADRLRYKASSGEADEDEIKVLAKRIAPRAQQHDYVKTLKSVEARAEALNGRVAQIEHKRMVREREKQIEAEYHAMTMARLAEEEERERRQDAERRRLVEEAAADQKKQRDKRAMDRILEKERIAQEGEQIKKAFQLQKEEEQRAAVEKQRAIQEMIARAARDNEKAIERKAVRALEERERDEAALAYQMQKAHEEKLREEAAAKVKAERERVFARMRQEQGRAADEKAAADAEQARRHYEARVLKERHDDARRAADKLQRDREQRESIEVQRMRRTMAKRVEAEEDKAQAEEWKLKYAESVERERDAADRKHEANYAHRRELEKTIAERAEVAAEAKNEKFRDRKDMLMQRKAEEMVLKATHEEAVGRMRRGGVRSDFSRDVVGMRPAV